MDTKSIFARVGLVGTIGFLAVMTVTQAVELKNLRRKLDNLEGSLFLEVGRLRGKSLLEGLPPFYDLDPRGPDNICRLRHDLRQLDGDIRGIRSGLLQYRNR